MSRRSGFPAARTTTRFATTPPMWAGGNSAVNLLHTPSMKNLDLALMKEFHLTEHKILRFQTTFSNAFNHPNFGYPDGDVSSPDTAPVITSTKGNYLSGSSTARIINFALRFTF